MSIGVHYLWFLVFYIFTKSLLHILFARYGDQAQVLGILA